LATPASPKWPTELKAEFINVLIPFKNWGDGTLPLANTAAAAAALFTLFGVFEYTGLVYDVEQCELLPLLFVEL
jgi:hypothetical protein